MGWLTGKTKTDPLDIRLCGLAGFQSKSRQWLMCFFMTSFLADNSTDRTKSQEKGGGHPNAEKIFLVENWTKLENEYFCEKKKNK